MEMEIVMMIVVRMMIVIKEIKEIRDKMVMMLLEQKDKKVRRVLHLP